MSSDGFRSISNVPPLRPILFRALMTDDQFSMNISDGDLLLSARDGRSLSFLREVSILRHLSSSLFITVVINGPSAEVLLIFVSLDAANSRS